MIISLIFTVIVLHIRNFCRDRQTPTLSRRRMNLNVLLSPIVNIIFTKNVLVHISYGYVLTQ